MKYAIIDFGSNTLRLSLYEVEEVTPPRFIQILNKKTMAGLAGYISEEGVLSHQGIDKAVEILNSYQRKIAQHKVPEEHVHIFATAVLRKAVNAQEAIDTIYKKTGLKIDLISGEDEARYGFFGTLSSLSISEGVQIDIGGGSTELVLFKDDVITHAHSLPFGSLSLYLQFVSGILPTPKEMNDIRAYVYNHLVDIPAIQGVTFPVISGVGGSIRAAAKIRDDWFLEGKRSEDPRLSADEFEHVFDLVTYDPHASLRNVLRVTPDRVHTAIPGMVCADTIRQFFSADHILTNKYGVREGYLLGKALGLSAR